MKRISLLTAGKGGVDPRLLISGTSRQQDKYALSKVEWVVHVFRNSSSKSKNQISKLTSPAPIFEEIDAGQAKKEQKVPFCLGGLVRKAHIPIFLPVFIFRLRIWLLLLYRRLRYGYAFRKIPLTQGRFALVDPEDYEKLSKYKWYAIRSKRGFYAGRSVGTNRHGIGPAAPPRLLVEDKSRGRRRGKQKTVRMHHVVLKAPEGTFIDHINHNGLDNRKSNLRLCTIQQNVWNMRKQRGNCTSQYKGVTRRKDIGKWQARIVCNRKTITIGFFDDEKAAAMAYDAKAKELFGEFAAPNLP